MNQNIDDRPFTIRRVAKPGSSITTAPMVVSCTWSMLDTDNIYRYVCKSEDLISITGCIDHKTEGCKGHHMKDQNDTAWLIPFGFATGDELRYSDAGMINTAVCAGDKTAEDVMEYCFSRIKGKRGILRKMCNSTRPTNTMRCVESPMKPNPNDPMSDQLGHIAMPNEFFDKGKFLFMTKDGRFEMTRMKEGDLVAYGRCPSQGVDSALPMKVRRTLEGEFSTRVPLDVCKMNNTDFDGDEAWVYKMASGDAIKEMEMAWDRVWVKEGRTSIYSNLVRVVNEAGGDPSIDPAMYTTMPLEDMISHPGGEMYDLLMLKPRNWNVMGKTTFEDTYWHSWVERSMDGIVNSMMSKYGIGEPYVQMRDAMMMGTTVIRDKKFIRVRTMDPQPVPAVLATEGMGFGSCASALTKMTASLYQREIDAAKHGKDSGKTTAVETLLKTSDHCFGFVNEGGPPRVKMMTITDATRTTLPYTFETLAEVRGNRKMGEERLSS
ncbi:hypothetical protein HRG_001446 [Hirsutella rhossiliensis]|uniref:Uncharacterized protein n=1 Tax=Hirsutella rhossiliensis TaxID=111463 RepID=A0A9P8NAP7_9HYPO|nr:uncharacterized protein HRG_01446 [Hirsutella rhossiliensis]KAH0968804.1 hypothetical protein HRG_01446 [Hirsutella rhossiliensis]